MNTGFYRGEWKQKEAAMNKGDVNMDAIYRDIPYSLGSSARTFAIERDHHRRRTVMTDSITNSTNVFFVSDC